LIAHSDNQDWFHESCLNLRERPVPSRCTTPVEGAEVTPGRAPANEIEEADDAASDASSSGLPPPLITAHDYESLVCGACVLRMNTLKRWAGTPGIKMVVRDNPSAPWTVMHSSQEVQTDNDAVEIEETSTSAAAGVKRPRTSSVASAPDAKRFCSSPSQQTPCLAPPLNPVAQSILSRCSSSNPDLSLGAGDVFLVDDWRGRWCRCSTVSRGCLVTLVTNRHHSAFHLSKQIHFSWTKKIPTNRQRILTVVSNVTFFEIPGVHVVSIPGLSLEELGMRALQRIPRDRAIDGIHAFNAMRCV
jgi:E3 ubiquitin-protein ligase UBR7